MSQKPIVKIKETSIEEWMVDIASTIAHAVTQLETLQRATVRRDDIGVTVHAYFNFPYVVKVDIVRNDKADFYTRPLPIDETILQRKKSS